MYDLISTPSVVVELEQVTENLKKMDALNRTYGIRVRPHIKPHRAFILRWSSCPAVRAASRAQSSARQRRWRTMASMIFLSPIP